MESGNEENCDFKCSRTEGNACNILKTHKRMGEHDDDGGGDDDDDDDDDNNKYTNGKFAL